MNAKADIIAQLQKDILLMQGLKPAKSGMYNDAGLRFIRNAFPNATFPTGVVHEFFCNDMEATAASAAFISGIVSSVINKEGISLWITSTQTVFPPALKLFGIKPDRIIFLQLKKEKEKLWAMEEALKCDGLSSVIGEINEFSFTESRRFQLATEQSRVTGFLIRNKPKNLHTCCVARWMIEPGTSITESDLPGVGFPVWNVSLLKIRNGKTGSWRMKWRNGRFELTHQPVMHIQEAQRNIV